MTKQNRTLGFVAILIIVILMIALFRAGKFLSNEENNLATDMTNVSQEQLGDVIKDSTTTMPINSSSFDKKIFSQLTTDLMSCLEIKGPAVASELPVDINSVIQAVQTELGPSTGVFDHWMYWYMKTSEGKEKRLRLELTENDEGRMLKELHYFLVDKDGQLSSLELPSEKTNNPSDEVIKEMLKEGEVFYKERGATVLFGNGERIEFVEKNDQLSDIEFIKGNALFRCQGFKAPESCQCVK